MGSTTRLGMRDQFVLLETRDSGEARGCWKLVSRGVARFPLPLVDSGASGRLGRWRFCCRDSMRIQDIGRPVQADPFGMATSSRIGFANPVCTAYLTSEGFNQHRPAAQRPQLLRLLQGPQSLMRHRRVARQHLVACFTSHFSWNHPEMRQPVPRSG